MKEKFMGGENSEGKQNIKEKGIPGIQEAQSFEDLYQAIQSVGVIEGSSENFTSDELIEIIEGFRKGEILAGRITSAGGIRKKAIELQVNSLET